MNRNEMPDKRLDDAIEAVRNEAIDPAVEAAAASSAWARIAAEAAQSHTIRSCGDFQALMRDFRAGKLSEARVLLLQDHVNQCVACRKALKAGPVPIRRDAPAVKPAFSISRYAAAAALVAAVASASWFGYDRLTTPSGSRATVQTVNGSIFKLTANGPVAIGAGEGLAEGEVIHTAGGARALVKLIDGSVVEMNERANLSVSARRRDTTIRLAGGNIIVQAAKRSSGHLFVQSEAARVAVTGTVFSVNSGTKGARVSVIEGEVHVDENRKTHVLRAGDQVATNPALGRTSIEDEIAWSQNFAQHMALMRDLVNLRTKLESVRLPNLRYGSRLTAMLPADTQVVFAMPNVGQAVGDAYRIFLEQLQSSPALREWYEQQRARTGKSELEEVIQRIRAAGDYLGDEVLIAMSNQGKHGPVILAETRKPGIEQFLSKDFGDVKVFDDSNISSAAGTSAMYIYTRPGYVAIAGSGENLRAAALNIAAGTGPFAQTAFFNRVNEVYREGAGFYLAADVQSVAKDERSAPKEAEAFARAGLSNVRYLVLEQKSLDRQADNRAVLSFAGPRTGFASWLGAPGPMRSLDYVSADANAAASFVVKNPAEMFNEFLAMLGPAQAEFEKAQEAVGVRIREDIVAALGAEVTIAVDGPMLPDPSWKVIAEVYNPGLLQQSIQRLVEGINREVQRQGKAGLQLTQEAVGPRVFYRISNVDNGLIREIHYTYDGSYLVAGPNRTLLQQAIDLRQSGATLTRSAQFQSLLPRDRQNNFSAVAYSNLGSVLGPLAGLLGNKDAAQAASAAMKPTLIAFYGDQDRIVASSRASILDLPLIGMSGPGFVGQMLRGKNGLERTKPQLRPYGK